MLDAELGAVQCIVVGCAQEIAPALAIGGGDKCREIESGNSIVPQTKQCTASLVDALDMAFRIEREVGNRCVFVQVDIAGTRFFEFVLGVTQPFILLPQLCLIRFELCIGHTQGHFVHFARGDVLHGAEHVVECSIRLAYAAHFGTDDNLGSILANQALFEIDRFDFPLTQANDIGIKLGHVVRMGDVLPGKIAQFVGGVTGDYASLVVKAHKTSCLWRDDGHADEGQVEKAL